MGKEAVVTMLTAMGTGGLGENSAGNIARRVKGVLTREQVDAFLRAMVRAGYVECHGVEIGGVATRKSVDYRLTLRGIAITSAVLTSEWGAV